VVDAEVRPPSERCPTRGVIPSTPPKRPRRAENLAGPCALSRPDSGEPDGVVSLAHPARVS
jgi:hypothetical protein